MKQQHVKFREALERAKEAATDRMKTIQQRKLMKIKAIREQKKYMIMKNQLVKVEENKEKAKVIAEE